MTGRGLYGYAIAFALGVAATLAGFAIGQSVRGHGTTGSALHEVLQHELDLDSVQKRKVDALDAAFRQQRAQLQADLVGANADLARAIEREHAYGPAVARAVDRSHIAMGKLQKATLSHVFAIRALLRPDQRDRFDKAVISVLTQPAQD